MSKEKIGRIGCEEWTESRANNSIAIYNANYGTSGGRLLELEKPWTVLVPDNFRAFHTYAEALAWAIEQIPEPDPTPKAWESVTIGWAPKPSHEDAWNEKWELTR